VDVLFSNGKQEWKVPAFWDGGKIWKVRFSAPEKGAEVIRQNLFLIPALSWPGSP